MPISPVDWIWYPDEGFYSSQCAQYYGSSRRFDQKGSQLTGQTPKPLVDFGPVKVLLDYSDGKGTPTTVTVNITPDGNPSWAITLQPLSLLLVTPFGDSDDPILRVV